MRLIDADDMIQDLRRQFEAIYKSAIETPIMPDDPFVELLAKCEGLHMKAYIDNLCEYIDARPTLDVQPVRRSKWVTDDDNNDDWAEPYCEKCGCFIPCGPAHFCPNCARGYAGGEL